MSVKLHRVLPSEQSPVLSAVLTLLIVVAVLSVLTGCSSPPPPAAFCPVRPFPGVGVIGAGDCLAPVKP